MGQLQIKMEGQFEFVKVRNVIMLCSQLCFVWMKASLVAYDCRESHKKKDLKIVKWVCQILPKMPSNPNLPLTSLQISDQFGIFRPWGQPWASRWSCSHLHVWPKQWQDHQWQALLIYSTITSVFNLTIA
jgi:hypothetical protein